MLCGAWVCVVASVLAFLKQGSSLQQYLIAGVVETVEVYAKMAHNDKVLAKAACRNFQFSSNCPAAFANTMLAAV